jgi:plastocyanin
MMIRIKKNNCDESGGGTNNAGCTTEKSLDIGQITIGTGHTSLKLKIDNPTDEEHQLIIESGSEGKTSEIGQSDEIKPGKNVEFKFKTDQVGELGYHCKYHPDMMNGTINVS